jgi:hypothetical protein
MLKKLDYDYIIASKPCLIEVDGGVTIKIDNDNNIIISGQNRLLFQNDTIDIEANDINIHAKNSLNFDVDGKIYIGSSTHIEQQAPRIDLNPKILSTGYRKK